MMKIIEHRCKAGCAFLAKDNPDDRPVCPKHRRPMKPGTVQVVSRLSREALRAIDGDYR